MIKLLINFRQIIIIHLAFCFLLIISSCSDIRQVVGKEKYIPDEYVFVKTPKLIIPPGFNINSDVLGKNNNKQEESMIILDVDKSNNEEFKSLFDDKNVPNNIRKIVDEETLGIGLSERSGLDILFGNTPETGIVLDAEKESLRIKNIKNNSKSILSGASPSFDINKQKNIDIK